MGWGPSWECPTYNLGRTQALTKQDLREEAGDAEWGKRHVGLSLLHLGEGVVELHREIHQSLPQLGLCHLTLQVRAGGDGSWA